MDPLFDISPTVSARLQVWPGDTPVSREVLADLRRGDNLTLSTLRTTVHAGAHADAPSHYGREAPSIDAADLSLYLGECLVVRVEAAPGERIGVSALPADLHAERVLIATGSYPDAERFETAFAALAPELVDWLADRGARLIGIDTPSVDLFDDKVLAAHGRCLARGVAIVEGLVLAGVPAGRYELIALPLKLEGFDASPVRAVLRRLAP
ncbi:MAG: cyclase family protein [Vicinamibacterales bacterium]|jgi:arylformamidase|nr:cyclase family protein [Vicinamibacterales bacterium]